MKTESQISPPGNNQPPTHVSLKGSAPSCDGAAREESSDEREGLPSASGMGRLAYCPGSFAAERGMPELPDADGTTDTGNRVHFSLETGEESDLDKSELEIKQDLEVMERKALADFVADFNLDGATPQVIRETRFWMRNRATLDLEASARPDVVYLFPKHALVLNYKTGFKTPTSAERNWQSRTEVISFWHEHPELELIRGGTAQSRLSSHFDSADYHADDLIRVEREMIYNIWRARQSDAPRVPGAWCRWCRAKANCKEAACYSMVATVGMPPKKDQLGISQAVSAMTPAQLGFVYKRKPTVETIFEHIKARLSGMTDEELAQAGFSKAPGNKMTVITDVPAAFLALSSILTDAQRAQCIKLTLGKAADLVAEARDISAKKAKELVEETVASFIEKKIGNPKLKPLNE